jgi:hypothetical protein
MTGKLKATVQIDARPRLLARISYFNWTLITTSELRSISV